jgi:predicted glutamine amidotransferase
MEYGDLNQQETVDLAMCRMVAFWTKENPQGMAELVDALIDSSRMDMYLEELYGSVSHSDGWGYALYIHRDAGSFIHSKTLNPIYNTIEYTRLSGLTKLIMDSEYSFGFMHSRHASRNMPRGLLAVHPFISIAKDGSIIAVAHNGSIYGDQLNKELGGVPGYGKLYPDSYLIAVYLARNNEDIVKAIRDLEEYTKTALNVSVLVLNEVNDESNSNLYVYTFVSEEKREDTRFLNYYRMSYVIKGSLQSVVSSTIADKLESYDWTVQDLSPKGDGFHVAFRNGRFKVTRIP